jgi:hypothetical protein
MARVHLNRSSVRAVFLLLALAIGCRQAPVEQAAPVLTPAPGTGVSGARLDAGRAIYVSEAKCARCHNPKPVYEHTADQWAKDILPRMAQKSKLSTDEYDSVLAYVTAGSQARPGSHAAP